MRTVHAVSTAAIMASLAFAASASADTYCVAPATGCDNTATGIQEAVNAAQGHAGPDTVRLGAATYPAVSVPTTQELVIEGAGVDQTIIASTDLASGQSVINRTNTSDLTVRDLTVSIGAAGGASGVRGIASPSIGGKFTGQRLKVSGPDSLTNPIGIQIAGDVALDQILIDLGGTANCIFTGFGTVTMSRVQVRRCGGITVQGGSAVIDRSRVEFADTALVALAGATVKVHNTVLLPKSGGTGLYATTSQANNTTLTARHVTIVQDGGAAVRNVIGSGTGNSSVAVYDSILRGATTDFFLEEAAGTVMTSVERSNAGTVNNTDVINVNGNGSFTATNTVDVDPKFLDDVNYNLAADSPLIDVDDTALGSDEPALDFNGSLRVINGKRDYGAIERPLAPTVTALVPSGVTDTSALLTGQLTTGGGIVLARLQYGPTIAYGQSIDLTTPPPSLGSSEIGQAIQGLTPGTEYHARVQVTNLAGGPVNGPDIAFRTTGQAPRPPVPPVAKVPVLSKLAFSPKKPTAGKAVSVSFMSTAAGPATLKVTKAVKGRKKGKSCSTKAKKGKRCTKTVSVYSKRVTLKTGTNKISIPKAKVRQGTFKVTVTPTGGKAISRTLKVGKKAKKRK